MGTLTALLLATPIFGFSLAPPQLAALPASLAPTAQVADAQVEEGDDASRAEARASTNLALSSDDAPAVAGPTVQTADEKLKYVGAVRRRAELAYIHRTLGIATWAATAVATIAGTIQYRNLYGAPFTTGLADSPCVRGNAWPNQDQCYGTPWFHAITGFTAGALYFTTAGFALAMPDPDHAAEGKSKFARTVRTHKILRWVHLTGMVTQMVLGIVVANRGLGLERANDYDTLKLLAGIHLASGYVTLGALTWAGSIMLF